MVPSGLTGRPVPTDDVELALARDLGGSAVVAGLDEVGRGAIAGPVVVGACAVEIIDGRVRTPVPDAVRDSKALTARRREALVDPIREGACAHALGWASAVEIDRVGIVPALTLAALRALGSLDVDPDAILLDGNVDVVTAHLSTRDGRRPPAVALRVGADRDCRSVAAASILAKVARDAHMVALAADAPDFAWERNKGYGSALHREALGRLGPHPEHRHSWNLLGTGPLPRAATAPRPDVLWSADDSGPASRPGADGLQEDTR